MRLAPIDDMAPSADETGRWARVCRIDPERVRRLALARRYPGRPRSWFGRDGPEWSPSLKSGPVCLACFDADRAAGRDAYLRASWTLAERCVCPLHRRLLCDRCPDGCGRLEVAFRLHDGRARPVCARCGRDLAGGAGEGGQPKDQGCIEAALRMQERIARAPGRRADCNALAVRPLERSAADYRRLAREILAHPDWIAARWLPTRKGSRIRGGLIDEELATGAVSVGRGASGRGARSPVRVGNDETARLERKSWRLRDEAEATSVRGPVPLRPWAGSA